MRKAIMLKILLRISIMALALGMLVAPPCVRSVEPLLETIIGTVSNGVTQQPIPHAVITFSSGSEKTTIESGNDGGFTVVLPSGTYHVAVSANGFDIAKRDGLVVAGQTAKMQIALYANGKLKTIANVSAGASNSEINVTPAAINSISSNQILAQGSIGIARVLAEIPGVQVGVAGAGEGRAGREEYAINSPANPVTIGIRGSQAYENAVLYDGHRINSNSAEFDG